MNNSSLLDKAGDVRDGEGFDLDVLKQYLQPVLGGDIGDMVVKQFPGGHSNLTYLLSCGSEQWVLRRPPFGSTVKSAHDMSREFKILSALDNIFPYGPVPIHFCDDHSIIGCDFYLMTYIEGLVIRREYPANLHLSPDQIRQQLFNFFDVLSELHSVDLVEAGLDTFGKPVGYVQRQIDGWCRRWEDAVTPDTVNCDITIKWLYDNMPKESGKASVIHNDYKMDNVIFSLEDPLKVIGVLDWEMSTVGDPLMDLGCTLGYWTQISDPDFFRESRTMPSDIEGAPTRSEIITRFQQQTGLAVDNFPFYFCFGLFRLAVIGQQIYYRYYHGLTKDQRFAGFIKKSFVLQQMCELIISGKIEN
ncbi:MAG: phosphotransferase family protein [SAR86 cluster bacterium]|uniref:Phosphotransferase family protein n=1 Tax=SAR86 cluster bacterium TaxID=2030880 RepID=A0A2A5B4G7_9GAMM|nr:MAG: phosphotransferase family protein [SAR86 cluster bacterium]